MSRSTFVCFAPVIHLGIITMLSHRKTGALSWIGRGALVAALSGSFSLHAIGQTTQPATQPTSDATGVVETPDQPAAVVTPAEEQPAARFANNIAEANKMAALFKEEFARMSEELQWKQDAVMAEDLEKAREVYDGIIAHFEAAAVAWSVGDETGAQKAQVAAHAEMPAKDVWRKRMFEFRRAQIDTAPSQQWYTETAASVQAGATPAFEKLVEAKKAVSEAWREVAEATVPGAKEETIEALKEKAFAAAAESEIALWQFSWANQLESVWSDKSVTRGDLEAPLAKLTEVQEELISLRRKQVEHERSVRQANAALGKAQQDLFKAFWAAREAKVKAAEAAAAGASVK
jgi:hypothetical protein